MKFLNVCNLVRVFVLEFAMFPMLCQILKIVPKVNINGSIINS